MKVNVFKKLIKEAVAEAIHEELHEMFSNQSSLNPLQESKTVSFNSSDISNNIDIRTQLREKMGASFGFTSPPLGKELKVIDAVDPQTGDKVNPYLAFINDAASNMTAQDRSGLRNLE